MDNNQNTAMGHTQLQPWWRFWWCWMRPMQHKCVCAKCCLQIIYSTTSWLVYLQTRLTFDLNKNLNKEASGTRPWITHAQRRCLRRGGGGGHIFKGKRASLHFAPSQTTSRNFYCYLLLYSCHHTTEAPGTSAWRSDLRSDVNWRVGQKSDR